MSGGPLISWERGGHKAVLVRFERQQHGHEYGGPYGPYQNSIALVPN